MLKRFRNPYRGINNQYGENNNRNSERKREKRELAAIIINTVLAVFTVWAIFLSKDSIRTANNTLAYAKHRDTLNDLTRRNRDSTDSIKYSIDTAKTNNSIRISNKSAEASIRALKDNKEKFIIENKAVIYVDTLYIEGMNPNKPIKWAIVFKNYGKSGAFLKTHYARIRFSNTLEIDDKLINEQGHLTEVLGFKNDIVPSSLGVLTGLTTTVQNVGKLKNEVVRNVFQFIPPNKEKYSTGASPEILTKEVIDTINSQKEKFVFLIGKLEYVDLANNDTYITSYCYYIQNNGRTYPYKKGNSIYMKTKKNK